VFTYYLWLCSRWNFCNRSTLRENIQQSMMCYFFLRHGVNGTGKTWKMQGPEKCTCKGPGKPIVIVLYAPCMWCFEAAWIIIDPSRCSHISQCMNVLKIIFMQIVANISDVIYDILVCRYHLYFPLVPSYWVYRVVPLMYRVAQIKPHYIFCL